MNVAKIRGFLLQLPKPSMVRCTGDGEPQELRPGKSYVKCAESIAALGPDLIECIDSQGQLLRAMRTTDADFQRSEAPALPAALAQDPQALLLTHFANLLHRAYEHSSEIAFTKLVELTERLNDRSEAIEQRLERTEAANRRLMQEQVDAAFERAEEQAEQQQNQSPLAEQLASSFLSGQLQPRGAAAKTNGKSTNGKGHV